MMRVLQGPVDPWSHSKNFGHWGKGNADSSFGGPRREIIGLTLTTRAFVSQLYYLSPLTLPAGKVLKSLRVRPLPSGGPGVVVHIVDPAPGISPHLPSLREGLWSLPRRAATVVVDVIPAAVLVKSGIG